MRGKNYIKLLYMSCTGIMLHVSPGFCQWPTLDLSQVTNMINGWTSQIESTSSTIQSTMSVGNIQQLLGDSVGGLSKFTSAEEKAEKLAQKIEKQKKRAEKLAELKEKYEKQVANAQAFAENIQSEVSNVVEAGQNLYEEGKSVYDEGMDVYEEARSVYDDVVSTVDLTKSAVNSGDSELETNAIGTTVNNSISSDTNSSLSTATNSNLSAANGVLSDEMTDGLVDNTAFSEDVGIVEKDISELNAGMEKNAVNQIPATTTENSALSEETAMPASSAIGQRRAFKTENAEPVSETTLSERQAFTTSSAEFTYQFSRSSSFAQTTTYKTGTNDDGKFIYSDIIANKCGINFDEIDEEKIAECVKIWVLGMHDKDATTASDWKKEYSKATQDHVASDLATALVQKTYSASFDSEVADDLENKSDALTSEREEISFVGKVAQTNQEVIIRLMEAMTSQVITDAWSTIEQLDEDYYDDEE